ncbi:MAG: hypothetical protein ACE5E7_01050 [Anaerolineae bacterium]
MNTYRFRYVLLIIMLGLALARWQTAAAHGGGMVQVSREPAGPYLVTVWLSPTPVRAGKPFHLSISIVSDDGRETPVLDAQVAVQLSARDSKAVVTSTTAPASAANRLIYEVDLTAPEQGAYRADITINGPAGEGEIGLDIAVEPPAGVNWLTIVLISLGIAVIIGLYRMVRPLPTVYDILKMHHPAR